ncbi:ATP synthase gamma chain [Musa troglodytarum]|uniref:ATP synthase gamma chain n=1 Tax=Musa troglodytarum TaxID=320322 RepID=A0A9E7JLY2_9LILI|nr:ATP synthase gamma chain [Musa troglodytarum]
MSCSNLTAMWASPKTCDLDHLSSRPYLAPSRLLRPRPRPRRPRRPACCLRPPRAPRSHRLREEHPEDHGSHEARVGGQGPPRSGGRRQWTTLL